MKEIRIGVVGAGWMCKAHSAAFKNVTLTYGTRIGVPVLEVVADVSAERARSAAEEFGFRRWSGDWRQVVEDPQVDVVDITTPTDAHEEIAMAAARAGKHIYCEKPLALTAAGARAMTEAAEAAGVTTIVGFAYLKNPVQQFARQLIASGEIGEIIQFRGAFDQDALVDPAVPFSWRFEKAVAGSGALGDLGSHIISLAQMLVGDFAEVMGISETFIKERPVAAGGTGYTASGGGGAMRAVENDDVTQFLCRFANGAIGTLGTSRIGTGRKIGLAYEIQGTKGALLFSQERMNELKLYRHNDTAGEQGFKTVFNSPQHPGYSGFFPIGGIPIGYNDLKIIEARDLLAALSSGEKAWPDFRFGYQVDRVVDAVLESAAQRRWVSLSDVA